MERVVIEIFRAGEHTDAAGRTLTFSEDDIAAIARAYDPKLHEAPVVIGHPEHDQPAWGWVKRLEARGASLFAELGELDARFVELVRQGRFKKISASFYLPDAPHNPKPGVWYLRHVGFLGAQPPAVKGLAPVNLADGAGEACAFTADFAEAEIGLFRRIREWILARFGREDADTAVPEEMLAAAEAEERMEDAQEAARAAREQQEREEEEQMKQELETLRARVAELEAEIARREREAEAAAYCERLEREGRLPPGLRPVAEALLAQLPEDASIAFGEEKASPAALVRKLLDGLPQVVEFGELAPEGRPEATPAPEAPAGYAVDPEGARLHAEALAYMQEHGCDYVQAVLAVSKKEG